MKAVVGQSSSPKSSRGWSNPRNLTILLVVLAAVVIGGILYWQHHSTKARQTAKVNAAIAQSSAAYNKGEYVNALNIVSNMAAQATSGKQKAMVYQMQAQAANSATKYADAARYYELKHLADPSSVKYDAYTLGVLYERLGQNDKALLQYKLALTYAKARHSQYGSDAPAVQAAIDNLEHKQ